MTVRRCGRVLPVNGSDEVLLLHGRDPRRPDDWNWFTVGGAVEPGESTRQAAAREMREETGVTVDEADLVGPFTRHTVTFEWDGARFENDSDYFALPLEIEASAVSFGALEGGEVGNIDRAGWWTAGDMEDHGVPANAALPEAMRMAVAAVRAAGHGGEA